MKKILIINANYYKTISYKLINSSKKILKKNKFNTSILNVPGIFEIPIAIRRNINKFDGFVVLGCVIKGKTPHFEFISKSTFKSILEISIKYNKPVGNGIITSFNLKQAKERCKCSNIHFKKWTKENLRTLHLELRLFKKFITL